MGYIKCMETADNTKSWKCQECGKRLTLKQAERAVSEGCPKCGGSDIDIAVDR